MNPWYVRWPMPSWSQWIQTNWRQFEAGAKLDAPIWLGAPSDAGFHPIGIALPQGQASDWGLSMPDKSRIHVHVYADGRRVVHRDKYDPAQGVDNMLAHLMQETPLVPAVLFVGVIALFANANG